MNKIWQKGCAMILVSFMLLTAVTALVIPAVKADENVTVNGSEIRAIWDDGEMVDHPELTAADETLVINADGAGNLIYLGDKMHTLSIDIESVDTIWGTWRATMSSASGNTVVSVDPSDTGGILTNNATTTIGFNVNVVTKAEVETSYKMVCTVTNETSSASQSFDFWVYVSSVYHPHSTNALRDKVFTYDKKNWDAYIKEDNATDDVGFEAGDAFAQGNLTVWNNANFAIFDVQANLTAPTGTDITLVKPNAAVMSNIAAGGKVQYYWRVNVVANKAPGIYKGTVEMNFWRTALGADVLCVELVKPIDFTVDFNFKDTNPGAGNGFSKNQCMATSVTIVDDGEEAAARGPLSGLTGLPSDTYQQSKFSDKKVVINVTIMNNANTPLYRAEYRIVPTASWDFFRDPTFFYTELGVIDYDRNVLKVDQLNVGQSINFTIKAIIVKEIPVGEHRLPINYTGYYYDDGSLGGSTGFKPINGGNVLTVYFSIFVTDGILDCKVTDVYFGVGGNGDYNDDLTNTEIWVDIENMEGYAFIDVIVKANFTGTPFYNPVVTERTTRGRIIDAVENPVDRWAPGNVLNDGVSFVVDVDPTLVPDRYPFTVEVVAIIETTLERVTTIIPAYVDVVGYGPRIWIDSFTTDTIEAGKNFDLTLSIRNDGDDTLRDAWVFIGADGTNPYPWNPLMTDFVEMINHQQEGYNYENIGSYIENYSDKWEASPVSLEGFDIDSAQEVVALNLYMDGVYSSPSARITLIWIGQIAPGQHVNVTFTMITDKDMVNGKPYVIDVAVYGLDTEGEDYEYDSEISVRTDKQGTSYQAVELDWFAAGMKVMGLILFIIIVLAVFIYVWRKMMAKKEEEQTYQKEPEQIK